MNMLNRAGEHICNGPAESKPLLDYGTVDASALSPSSKAKAFAVVSEYPIVAFVPCLLRPSCPAAIAGLVIAVIVLAVKRVLGGRLWAHIGKERHEGFPPSTADLDVAAAITGIRRLFWVVAAIYDAAPDAVFSGSALAVSGGSAAKRLADQAPTTPGCAGEETGNSNDSPGAAGTFAVPSPSAILGGRGCSPGG